MVIEIARRNGLEGANSTEFDTETPYPVIDMMEEQKKEVEQDLEQAILKGRRFGISDEDIKTLFELILEG